jgi:hypothetical protein
MRAWARKNLQWLFWLALPLLVLALYFPLLRLDPILGRDDRELLLPLFALNGWGDFFRYAFSSGNPDLQPVRDFSLWIDVILAGKGFRNFHAQNALLWVGCCFVFERLASRVLAGEWQPKAFAFLFALHPVYVMSVSWVSARKHLLAFFFLLLALLALVKYRGGKVFFWVTVFYLLSVFSQPIYVLFPLWLLLCLAGEGKIKSREGIFAGFLSALMAGAMLWNRQHYQAFYEKFSEKSEKLAALDFFHLVSPADSLLAAGRYVYQILVPLEYSVIYSRASWENVLGLALFPLLVYGSGRLLGRKKAALLWAFFLLMLGLVLTKVHTIFISDTYVLGASLAFWFLAIKAWQRWGRQGLALTLAVALLFFAKSRYELRFWENDLSLWEHAYAQEPDCESSMAYATFLFRHEKISEALNVTDFHLKNFCTGEVSISLYHLALFYNGQIPDEEKIRALADDTLPSDTGKVLLAILYLKKNEETPARRVLGALAQKDPQFRQKLLPLTNKALDEALRAKKER